jgi:hypothetical protein
MRSMTHAFRQEVVVDSDGRIVVYVPQLTPGTKAEVIVREPDSLGADGVELVPLASLVGSCKGMFSGPEEADEFIRRERDAWDSQPS